LIYLENRTQGIVITALPPALGHNVSAETLADCFQASLFALALTHGKFRRRFSCGNRNFSKCPQDVRDHVDVGSGSSPVPTTRFANAANNSLCRTLPDPMAPLGAHLATCVGGGIVRVIDEHVVLLPLLPLPPQLIPLKKSPLSKGLHHFCICLFREWERNSMSENVKVTVEEFKRDPGCYLNEVGDNRSMEVGENVVIVSKADLEGYKATIELLSDWVGGKKVFDSIADADRSPEKSYS
jgi:hypothetical protein